MKQTGWSMSCNQVSTCVINTREGDDGTKSIRALAKPRKENRVALNANLTHSDQKF